MTHIAQQPPTAPLRVQDVALRRVLVSEWIKFWSLRSTVLTLLAAVVAMVVVGCLASWAFVDNWDELTAAERAGFNPIDPALVGVNLAQLAVGVLGVLLITGEYATGMIRATLSAVPTRLPVLWAKAGLYAAVTFVLMAVTSLIAFLTAQLFLGDRGADLGVAELPRALLGSSPAPLLGCHLPQHLLHSTLAARTPHLRFVIRYPPSVPQQVPVPILPPAHPSIARLDRPNEPFHVVVRPW